MVWGTFLVPWDQLDSYILLSIAAYCCIYSCILHIALLGKNFLTSVLALLDILLLVANTCVLMQLSELLISFGHNILHFFLMTLWEPVSWPKNIHFLVLINNCIYRWQLYNNRILAECWYLLPMEADLYQINYWQSMTQLFWKSLSSEIFGPFSYTGLK